MTNTKKISMEDTKSLRRIRKYTSQNTKSKQELRRSSRLLGIYRNGAKGKCIRKDESKNVLDKARLDADALKLFSGDTPEEYYGKQTVMNNDTTMNSSNKEYTKENLNLTASSLEQSPILGNKQRSDGTLLTKKRYMQTLGFEENKKRKLKESKSKCAVSSEDIHKEISCQKEQNKSKCIDKAAVRIHYGKRTVMNNDAVTDSSNKEYTKENLNLTASSLEQSPILGNNQRLGNVQENRNTRQICLNNNNGTFKNFLKYCYGKMVFLNNKLNPTTTNLKQKLKNFYSERSQLYQRDGNNYAMLTSKPIASSVETCTNNTSSQSSSINFEVDKCNENAIATVLQTYTQKDDEFHSKQSNEGTQKKEDRDLMCNNPKSPLDQKFIYEDDNQSAKRSVSSDISQHTQPVNCNSMNEKRSSCIFYQKKSNCNDFPAKNNDNITKSHISKNENSLHLDDTNNRFSDKSWSLVAPKKRYINYLSKTLSTNKYNYVDSSNSKTQQCIGKTSNYKRENVKSTILPQCNDMAINKDSQSVQNINDSHMESLFNEVKDKIPNTSISLECYEKEQPNSHTLLSSKNESDLFKQTVDTEPDRNRVQNFEINMRPLDMNEQNNPSQLGNFESLFGTNEHKANEYETNEHEVANEFEAIEHNNNKYYVNEYEANEHEAANEHNKNKYNANEYETNEHEAANEYETNEHETANEHKNKYANEYEANEHEAANEFDTNEHVAGSSNQDTIGMDLRKKVHVNDYRSVDCLQESNSSNFNVEQHPQRFSSRTYESNNTSYDLRRTDPYAQDQDSFHRNNDTITLSPSLIYQNTRKEFFPPNTREEIFLPNTREEIFRPNTREEIFRPNTREEIFRPNTRHRSRCRDSSIYSEIFSRGDAVRARSQINHSHFYYGYNRQNIDLYSNRYKHETLLPYTSHEEAGLSSRPIRTSYDTRNYNNSNTDNRVINLVNSTQNMPLSLSRHEHRITPRATDQHQRPASILLLQPVPYLYYIQNTRPIERIETPNLFTLISPDSQTQVPRISNTAAIRLDIPHQLTDFVASDRSRANQIFDQNP